MPARPIPVLTHVRRLMAATVVLALAACDGPQSTLNPAGVGAERIADLWWWMFGGAVVIWVLVIGLALYATRFGTGQHDVRKARLLIVGAGAVFPTIVLAGLLVWGLRLMPVLRPPTGTAAVRVEVEGLRWWWRVTYVTADGRRIPLANEIRLPVGQLAAFTLTSPDVIHSFWIPSLGGKMDMIPGRVTELALEPTRTGVFRGACAEYCGTSHALMQFGVEVMEPAAFDDWLAGQAAPAEPPASPEAERGQALFLAFGCGACHAVRGTPADGTIGPDLTHVGGRLTLGAGILPNDPDAFARWIGDTHEVKPDAEMPPFGMLPEADLRALALYLDGLT